MGQMAAATEGHDLLTGLHALADVLAREIDACEDGKAIAGLARQYLESMTKIDDLEGGADGDVEIAAIILRNRKPAAD